MNLKVLEKPQGWIRFNSDNELLEMSRLYELAIMGHIQIDFPYGWY